MSIYCQTELCHNLAEFNTSGQSHFKLCKEHYMHKKLSRDCNSIDITDHTEQIFLQFKIAQKHLNSQKFQVIQFGNKSVQIITNTTRELLKKINEKAKLLNEWILNPIGAAKQIIKDLDYSSFCSKAIVCFTNVSDNAFKTVEDNNIDLEQKLKELLNEIGEIKKQKEVFRQNFFTIRDKICLTVNNVTGYLADLGNRLGGNWRIHLDFRLSPNVVMVRNSFQHLTNQLNEAKSFIQNLQLI